MKKTLAILLALPIVASAQGYAPFRLSDAGDVCYQWEGGHGSAGSYSRCSPAVVLAQAPVAPKIVEVIKEVPIITKAECPTPMSAPPARKPIVRKPRPKVQC